MVWVIKAAVAPARPNLSPLVTAEAIDAHVDGRSWDQRNLAVGGRLTEAMGAGRMGSKARGRTAEDAPTRFGRRSQGVFRHVPSIPLCGHADGRNAGARLLHGIRLAQRPA